MNKKPHPLAWRTAQATPEAIQRAELVASQQRLTGCVANVLSFMYVTDADGKEIPEESRIAVIEYVKADTL